MSIIKMIDVFSVPSTGQETHMTLFILEQLKKLNITNYSIDLYGNISICKGLAVTYPMFTAHLDTVHSYNNGYNCGISEGLVFAWDNDQRQVGVGGDDKSGIYVCLKLLEILPAIKVVFFSREESGGIGSKNFDVSFLSNCRFVGGVDRRNITDFVTSYHGDRVVSDEFMEDIQPLLIKYNRTESTGAFTDAFALKVDLVRFNMSAAYYDPHTSKEVVKVEELDTTFEFCLEITKKCIKQYHYIIPVKKFYTLQDNHNLGFNYSNHHNVNRNKLNKQHTLFDSLANKEEPKKKESEWDKLIREQNEEWEMYYNSRYYE